MFQIVAVPFEAHRQLPTPAHRWVLLCLSRYADKAGVCFPTMRQLAADARLSLSTVQRRLKELAELGVFQRVRRGVGRYVYTLAEAYRPSWKPRVSGVGRRVSGDDTPEANPHKQPEKEPVHDASKWEPRLRAWRKSRFWLPFWGPKPGQPGCFAPGVSRET